MAFGVSELISNAVANLDAAYANDPNGDTEAMVITAIESSANDVGDSQSTLTFLGNSNDFATYIDSDAVETAMDNIVAAITDAVNAELVVLQGS